MRFRGLILAALVLAAGAAGAQTVALPLAANVAALPTCGTARNGQVYGVRDALAPVVGDVVVGGGAVRVVVQCDTSAAGIKWVVQAPGAGGGGGASSFDELDSGTNTTAAMVVGTGASLAATGSGTIAATSATTATTATTANAGDSATAFFSAGTIEHERGGLEADVSAFAGLVRIAAGATSAVTNLSGLNTALGSSIADGAHTVDTDTTCLDAGVACLFAGSASEGGAATSALDLTCTNCIDDTEVTTNAGTALSADLEEETHATEHQNGGADEVATATAGANAIPKAGAGGTLADGWIASSNVTQHEAALEGVLDLPDLQGQIADAQIAAGAVDGGNLGEIADGSVTADDLGTDSVSADELNATGVEAELEAVQDLQDFQGAVTDAQVPDSITLALESASLTAILDDEVLVGTGAAAGAYTAIQNCDDTTGKLDWTGTAFACVTDQTGGGGSLTVEEADASPTVASVDTIQFDSADGFTVTDETGGNVQVDLFPKSIDVDADGTAEVSVTNTGTASSSYVQFAPHDNTSDVWQFYGNQVIRATSGNFTFANASGTASFVIAGGIHLRSTVSGSASAAVFTWNSDTNTGMYRPSADDLRLTADSGDFIGGTTSEFDVYKIRDDDTQVETCADNGAGTNAALTITPTKSYVEITSADAHGCDVTISETGAAVGRVVDFAIVAVTAGTVNFADTAGVTELAGAFAAAIDDYISLRYGTTTTWRERFRSNN